MVSRQSPPSLDFRAGSRICYPQHLEQRFFLWSPKNKRPIFFSFLIPFSPLASFVLEESTKKEPLLDGRDTHISEPQLHAFRFFSSFFCCVRDARSGVVSASQFSSVRKTSPFFFVLVKDKKTAAGIPYPILSSQSHAGCVIRVGIPASGTAVFFCLPKNKKLSFGFLFLGTYLTELLLRTPAFIHIAQYETYR